MRIIFAGTPEFATETLKALLNTDHEICAVYTQPDRPSGRGRKLTASPVKQIALDHNIPVEQPLNFKVGNSQQQLAQYNASLMIVVAYGLLLPQTVLDLPRLGCINVHASLLPRWRGAAPIQRAILAGDTETGVCIMQMEAKLDTGPVLSRASLKIAADDTSKSLHDKLALLGAETLLASLPNLVTLQKTAQQQDNRLATYANKLFKSEADINWQLSAIETARQVNGFNPWPIAQTHWHDQVFRIWQAVSLAQDHTLNPGEIIAVNHDSIDVATGQGVLRLLRVQLPGKKAMPVADFLNANTVLVGDKLA